MNRLPFPSTWVQPRFLVGFVLLGLQFYVYVLQNVVCPFVLFVLVILLSVLLRFTDSDYPFGIFKRFFYHTVWYKLIIGVKFKVNVKKLGSYFYLKFCEKYIKGMQSAKFGLLLDRRLSIHMTGRLKVLYSVLFVFGQFCINSAS